MGKKQPEFGPTNVIISQINSGTFGDLPKVYTVCEYSRDMKTTCTVSPLSNICLSRVVTPPTLQMIQIPETVLETGRATAETTTQHLIFCSLPLRQTGPHS